LRARLEMKGVLQLYESGLVIPLCERFDEKAKKLFSIDITPPTAAQLLRLSTWREYSCLTS
jgi:hypothetical protein